MYFNLVNVLIAGCHSFNAISGYLYFQDEILTPPTYNPRKRLSVENFLFQGGWH